MISETSTKRVIVEFNKSHGLMYMNLLNFYIFKYFFLIKTYVANVFGDFVEGI